MLQHYLILDLPLTASDQEIRDRYLELVKKFTPERDPKRFNLIAQAYDALKDARTRVETRLFSVGKDVDYDDSLTDLINALPYRRKSEGLQKLIEAINGHLVK